MTNLSIIYDSSTGHGARMAHVLGDAAEEAGATVRLRHIAETRDPETFASNPAWTGNNDATEDLPPATGDDSVWAEGVPGLAHSIRQHRRTVSNLHELPGAAWMPIRVITARLTASRFLAGRDSSKARKSIPSFTSPC